MPGEGHISAMLATLKRNRIPKRDNKRGHLEYRKGLSNGTPLIYKNTLSKKEFTEFVEKLKAEKRLKTRIFILLFLAIIPLISYFVFTYI